MLLLLKNGCGILKTLKLNRSAYLTLGLPPFFYPAVYRGVENDTEGFTAAVKANSAEFTKFYKYLSTLAMILCYWSWYKMPFSAVLQMIEWLSLAADQLLHWCIWQLKEDLLLAWSASTHRSCCSTYTFRDSCRYTGGSSKTFVSWGNHKVYNACKVMTLLL